MGIKVRIEKSVLYLGYVGTVKRSKNASVQVSGIWHTPVINNLAYSTVLFLGLKVKESGLLPTLDSFVS